MSTPRQPAAKFHPRHQPFRSWGKSTCDPFDSSAARRSARSCSVACTPLSPRSSTCARPARRMRCGYAANSSLMKQRLPLACTGNTPRSVRSAGRPWRRAAGAVAATMRITRAGTTRTDQFIGIAQIDCARLRRGVATAALCLERRYPKMPCSYRNGPQSLVPSASAVEEGRCKWRRGRPSSDGCLARLA